MNKKYEQQIMVVPCEKLFNGSRFQGFCSHQDQDYHSSILEHGVFDKRGPAETDPTRKQPIPYVLIVDKKNERIFTYQRAGSHTEGRLANKLSCGVGGHVEPHDECENHLRETMRRELHEEVYLTGTYTSRLAGYINADDDGEGEVPVGAVHFGLLYIVETNGEVMPKDDEIAEGAFKDKDELITMLDSEDYQFEGWTRIALEHINHWW